MHLSSRAKIPIAVGETVSADMIRNVSVDPPRRPKAAEVVGKVAMQVLRQSAMIPCNALDTATELAICAPVCLRPMSINTTAEIAIAPLMLTATDAAQAQSQQNDDRCGAKIDRWLDPRCNNLQQAFHCGSGDAVDVRFAAVSSSMCKALDLSFTKLSGDLQGVIVLSWPPRRLRTLAQMAVWRWNLFAAPGCIQLILAASNRCIPSVLNSLEQKDLSLILAQPNQLVRSG